MTTDLRIYVLLIDYRKNQIIKKFGEVQPLNILNNEENKSWYFKNISHIDYKIIKTANKILRQNGVKDIKIRSIDQICTIELLTQLYNQEKRIYPNIINQLEK